MNIYQLIYVAKTTNMSFRKAFPWTESLKIFSLAGVCGVIVFPVNFLLPYALWRILIAFVLHSGIFVIALFGLKILRPDEKEMLFLPWNFLKTKLFAGSR